ncbi:MAG: hypothetical protein FIA97_06420, partial [Methylococcaceae bacterium]|nr:hypothetical protein [Methylococcaceae bacterium]
MRLLNFMLHLLLVTLLAVSGIGAANAKVASGPQHLGQGSQPVESALNLLWHQEKTGISYDAAPGSSVVAKG